MSNTILGGNLPNIPWQEKPANVRGPVWRYSGNPIVGRDATAYSNSIFNSAVVPFDGKFAGVFRIDDIERSCNLHLGFSTDAVHWQINDQPIAWDSNSQGLPFEYGYDPRVVWLEDRYYITWCTGIHSDPAIGCAWTKDFRSFHLMENLTLPCNRNGVLFPRRLNGKYAMLSRPSDAGHTPFGSIYYSESPDLVYWGKHRFVMAPTGGWQRTKIGAGPVPIETKHGWLMIYHGVGQTCNGMVYSMGSALLDLEKPWQVIARTKPYLLNPREIYECVGDVPNVLFPVSVLSDAATGRLAIYYGGADTVIGLAFAQVDELIDYTKKHSKV